MNANRDTPFSRFNPGRRFASLAILLVTATLTQATEMTEADIIRQLSARPIASSDTAEPSSVFAGEEPASKSLIRIRRPDTTGACLADNIVGASTKELVVIALAPAGAPQVSLPLQFATGRYKLSASDIRQLDILARAMVSSQLSGARFTISGHTDATGDPMTNEKLSCARALSARTHLVERGISGLRLSAYGFGSSRPVVAGAKDAAENRRVEIRRADD